VGGRGEPRNSKNLPRWAAEFGKWRRGIWQNLPRKTVVPKHQAFSPPAIASCQASLEAGTSFLTTCRTRFPSLCLNAP